MKVYLEQIDSLQLENPPPLIFNKSMEKKELELIDQMPKIKQFHNMNKGMQSLIQQ